MILQQTNQDQEKGYLIIIFGVPGSGKTTFANKLKEKVKGYIFKEVIKLSGDSVQEYLRDNDVKQLDTFINNQDSRSLELILDKYDLKKGQFKEQNWKASRDFIKNNLHKICKPKHFLIYEDDLLLKSQRKSIRKSVSHLSSIKYLQILLDISLQQCLQNNVSRNKFLTHSFQISNEIIQASFEKLEVQNHQYLIKIKKKQIQQIQTSNLLEQCKAVVWNVEEQKEKIQITEQNHRKDQIQIQIRNVVGKVMKEKQLQIKFFGTRSKRYIAERISDLKKQYLSNKTRQKSGQDFMSYLFDMHNV